MPILSWLGLAFTRFLLPMTLSLGGGFIKWFGPTAKSVKGVINWTELLQSVVTGAGGGTILTVLSAIQGNESHIFNTSTITGTIVSWVVISLIDLAHRMQHGAVVPSVTPAVTPAVTPTPAPSDPVPPGAP